MHLKFIIIFTFAVFSNAALGQVIDSWSGHRSDTTLNYALRGTDAPLEVVSEMAIIDVEYYSIDSMLHRGQVVINRALVDDIIEIFAYIKEIRYPVEMVIPIKFDMPNGMTTMAHLNNCYGFHYRKAISSNAKLSSHSMGRAIDFNPFNNPYLSADGDMKPKGAKYDIKDKRTLTVTHPLVKKMKQMGWSWGGDWSSIKDYMHFEKNDK